MVIQQPNRSTWNEVDIRSKVSRFTFKRRYQRMVAASKDYPFLLLNNLSNEIDLGTINPRQRLADTESLLLEAMALAPSYPSSYSTYYTMKNYPVDILGINMLDTGETYWGPGLRALKYYNKPFYASEFGGFTAFHEKTPPWLRIARLGKQWRSLLRAGGVGACLFQSHDNWGQPVPTGYNDPFRPEMPDDLRGYWDLDNKPKLELRFVTQLFSDLSAKVVEETIASSAAKVTLDIANIRNYQLERVKVFGNGRLVADLGTLAVGETKRIDVKVPNKAILHLRFEYTTHHGLKSLSKLDLPLPLINDRPHILNTDFIVERESAGQITGTLLLSDRLEVVLPETWKVFSFNGKRYERGNGRKCFTVVNPFHPVKNLRYTRDGRRTHPFDPQSIKAGRYGLRFDLPDLPAQNRERLLIMGGLGAKKLRLRYGEADHLLEVHSYRENIVLDLNKLSSKSMEEKFVVQLERIRHGYDDPSLSDFRTRVFVNVEHPKVFSPLHVVLKKL